MKSKPFFLGPWLLCSALFGSAVSTDVEQIVADRHSNLTLKCNASQETFWVFGTRAKSALTNEDGSLLLIDVDVNDDNMSFSCREVRSNASLREVRLRVRRVPPRVRRLRVRPRNRFALLLFEAQDDLVDHYRVNYKRKEEMSWHNVTVKSSKTVPKRPVSSTWSTVTAPIYGLVPDVSYLFRVCAANGLGCSPWARSEARTDSTKENKESSSQDLHKASSLQIWLLVLGVVVFVVSTLSLGLSLLLLKNCPLLFRTQVLQTTSEEAMELVPQITLNPSFDSDDEEERQPSQPKVA